MAKTSTEAYDSDVIFVNVNFVFMHTLRVFLCFHFSTNSAMHQSFTPPCIIFDKNVHIYVTKWCIAGYQ